MYWVILGGFLNMKIIASTEELIIREFTEQDLFPLALVCSHPEVMKFSRNRKPLTLQETKEALERIFDSYQKKGWGLWAVIDKDDYVLIGYCGLQMQEVDGEQYVELGYRLAHSYWGQGFATQAACAVRDYAFDTLGMNSIISIIEPENSASIRVAQKVGMALWKQTEWHDTPVSIYRIDRPESC